MYISLWISLIFGALSFSLLMKHLLGMLLSLEFLVLLVFSFMVFMLNFGVTFMSMVFLVFSVCEGALGLTILVNMSRAFGGDYLNIFSLMI
uniref:NADH-ubiquinone oxidoreductase chain 4L n=1 Tax=Friesea antarctica TaxID=2720488 RepID=B2BSE7_9HEXA|nr:NADH dehydrogenase subunit 4L [Friesea antarctica]ABS57600.1 NADH dehydrogenase subunit 4L [Friesea antarctica]